MVNILYISVIGISEPLGKSQVLEYLKVLSQNYSISLHTFEKNISSKDEAEIQEVMDTFGINWTFQTYSNRFGMVSTLFQIISSFTTLLKLVHSKPIHIIHARSQIPVIIALSIKTFSQVKVLFDIRGFQIDEKAEIGRIKVNGITYNILKWLELLAYKKSDSIVSLTYNAKKIIGQLTESEKITVIPTCANSDVFKVEDNNNFKRSLGYNDADKVIIHVGTVSNWYDFDSELILINTLFDQDKDLRFLILNKGESNFIEEKLAEHNVCRGKVKIESADFYDVYKYLNFSEASLFIIKPTFSKRASAPTKFAENLCCDLYSITNNDIGDMNMFIQEYPEVGYSFDVAEVRSDTYTLGQKILQALEQRERHSKQYQKLYTNYMSNDIAIERYKYIYKNLSTLSI